MKSKSRWYVLELEVCKTNQSKLRVLCSSFNFKIALLKKVKELHGEYGHAAVSLRLYVKYIRKLKNVIIINVLHGPHIFVASVIPFMMMINGCNIELRTLYVAGTDRKVYDFINHHYKEDLEEALPQAKEDDFTVFK